MKPVVTARWERVLLVCRKCSRKLGGGFGPGGEERLAKRLGGGKGRKARVGVIEVGCLDICPKGGAVVIDASTPGEWLLVGAGTPVAELAARLGFAAES